MVRQVPSRAEPELFKPGDEVSRSGIYRAIHANQHAKAHDVTCVYSDRFPACRSCGQDVRFALVLGARYITSHEYFKSPYALPP
jgi:hypothetical protein